MLLLDTGLSAGSNLRATPTASKLWATSDAEGIWDMLAKHQALNVDGELVNRLHQKWDDELVAKRRKSKARTRAANLSFTPGHIRKLNDKVVSMQSYVRSHVDALFNG